jgi:hypothetical protein
MVILFSLNEKAHEHEIIDIKGRAKMRPDL